MPERRLQSSSLRIVGVYRDNSSPLLMVFLATTLGAPASHALNTDVLSSCGDLTCESPGRLGRSFCGLSPVRQRRGNCYIRNRLQALSRTTGFTGHQKTS